MLTIDIEKAFDSIDHAFLFAILDKLGFDTNFIKWKKALSWTGVPQQASSHLVEDRAKGTQ